MALINFLKVLAINSLNIGLSLLSLLSPRISTRNILSFLILLSTSLNFSLIYFHHLVFLFCNLDNFLRSIVYFMNLLFICSLLLSLNLARLYLIHWDLYFNYYFVLPRNCMWFIVRYIWTILIVLFTFWWLVLCL